ncbi:MAG: GntR family transcriptional regulator, partial [Verrucomicrobia bacterium]
MPVYRTIREQITERIRADLLAQRFAAGATLREQALAKRYGVSRAPVRDALLQLTNEGLLVARPHCGVQVADLPDESLQPLVIELRRKIESFALRR